MSYGLTLDQVRHIHRPAPAPTPWGSLTACTLVPHYSLYRVEIKPGAAQPLHFHPRGPFRLYVEEGDVTLRALDANGHSTASALQTGSTFSLARYAVYALASTQGTKLYLFGPHSEDDLESIQVETLDAASMAVSQIDAALLPVIGEATTDVREKYWGRIETILDSEVAGKRIFIRKGGQSSLEFHVQKHETYYIHAGLLRIGLRIGRAENHSIVLGPGESYDVHPGVMHMRMALEDTVILEASTKDSDADSYLVEDGQTYRHIDADATASLSEKQEQPA